MDKDKGLCLINSDELTSVSAKEIDQTIDKILQESRKNYVELGDLALECSAALSSAQARSAAISQRGFFKRAWDKVTGKDDRVRSAIAKDQAVAQYAMQQTINGVLKECTSNRELALLIKNKVESEIIRIENDNLKRDRESEQIRCALVRFYNGYLDSIEKIQWRIDEREMHDNKRCEYCREKLYSDQVVCPYCGTIQDLKIGGLSMKEQNELKEISRLMTATPEKWVSDIEWSKLAQKYADIISRTSNIAKAVHVIDNGATLDKDIADLITKCRSAEFQIAVVGVVKAGKSMLLNALIGEELAPVGINSTTAALTKFRSSQTGNYVKVRFYSQQEWVKLCKSAQASARPIEVQTTTYSTKTRTGKVRTQTSRVSTASVQREKDGDSLLRQLRQTGVQESAKKWIGHATYEVHPKTFEEFRKEIQRWTAANSADHLFASEVEVGIDKKHFDMPEEVVFVDTPGLKDPVKYRSQITEEYIKRADAVLIAVETHYLSEEPLSTITTVLDHAGSNKKKVFIVATQKDKLNSEQDYYDIIEGKEGWINRLVATGRYKTVREVNQQIFGVSAQMHLLLKKVMKLSDKELEDPKVLPDKDYNLIENAVKKAIGGRGYSLNRLKQTPEDAKRVFKTFGIDELRMHLDRGLIENYRNLKMKNIAEDFQVCKAGITRHLSNELSNRQAAYNAAKSGIDTIAMQLEAAKSEKEKLDCSRKKIQSTLEALRKFTQTRIQYNSYLGE